MPVNNVADFTIRLWSFSVYQSNLSFYICPVSQFQTNFADNTYKSIDCTKCVSDII